MLEESDVNTPQGKVVAIDARYKLVRSGIFDNGVFDYCERLKQIYEKRGYTIVKVPTMDTNLDFVAYAMAR